MTDNTRVHNQIIDAYKKFGDFHMNESLGILKSHDLIPPRNILAKNNMYDALAAFTLGEHTKEIMYVQDSIIKYFGEFDTTFLMKRLNRLDSKKYELINQEPILK